MRALPLLLLLAACGGTASPPPAAPPVDPAVAACRQEAQQDKEVQATRLRRSFSNTFYSIAEAELREAEDKATRDCLRRRGVTPRGGVERERPYN